MPYYLTLSFWNHLIKGDRILPWMHVGSIAEVDPEALKQSGIKGIIFDVDNTLTDHHQRQINPIVREAFQRMQREFSCSIFSNCGRRRHQELLEIFEIPVTKSALKKPNPEGFLKACGLMNLPAESVTVIGDRIMTDILGGNLAGMKTVLVDPFTAPEPLPIKLMRKLERYRYRSLMANR